MKDTTLWRKQSHIIILISEALNVGIDQALDIFYRSKTYQRLKNQDLGLHLMSDNYLLEDILNEISTGKNKKNNLHRNLCD